MIVHTDHERHRAPQVKRWQESQAEVLEIHGGARWQLLQGEMVPVDSIRTPVPFEWHSWQLHFHYVAMERKLERIHEEYLNDNL
jgi:hypothetical protein